MQSDLDFSLVLACYRDAPHLVRNVLTLDDYLSFTKLRYEIILVEDGSPDDTLAEVERASALLRERAASCQVIVHKTNQGRGATVQDGFLAARGDVVCYIDIDLEHRPDAMLSMYTRIASGECDGIVAKRLYESAQVRLSRLILSRGYRLIVGQLLDLPVTDTESGFKMFKRDKLRPVLDRMVDRQWFWDTEIVARAADAGLKLIDHPIIFVRDQSKQSTVRVIEDTVRYVACLLKFVMQQRGLEPTLVKSKGVRLT